MIDLNQSLKSIKGVGDKTYQNFKDLNIYTLGDLIFTLPKKYSVYEKISYSESENDTKASIEGVISSQVFVKKLKKLDTVIFYLETEGINLKVLAFGKPYLRYQIKKGMKVVIYGQVHKDLKEIVMQEIFLDNFNFHIEKDYKLKNISNKLVDKIVSNSIGEITIPENLPESLIKKYRLISKYEYIKLSHFPLKSEDLRQIYRRDKYETYLSYSLELECMRHLVLASFKPKKEFDMNKINLFIEKLPYKLTEDQINALNDIKKDMESENIMSRLLQGDVGSGKTIVSVIASYMQYLAGYQVALMCPTEVLANQHFKTFKNLLEPLNLKIEMLTSNVKEKDKKVILEKIEDKKVDILIGTHALLYHKLKFKNLGLLIVDEQHRFGVSARSKILNDNKGIDSLYLTATPIPRTLGITKFGDLDISSLHTKPSGRKDVKTYIVENTNFDDLIDPIKDEIKKGHQLFAVVPQINESESFDILDTKGCKELLEEKINGAKIEIIHGKMSAKDKNDIMIDFINKKFDILVSTTVIEVGIDIKNATGIIIFNAERFGLSTLHQLRGRVGRNSFSSFCAMVTNKEDTKRLKVLEKTNDCFILSEEDFILRGPGDILGDMQSGYNTLDFTKDIKIYECAKEDAAMLFSNLDLNIPIVRDTYNKISFKKYNLN